MAINVRQLNVGALVLWAVLLPIGAVAQQEIVCGSEAQVARARAVRLERAAAGCRQDLAKGHPSCQIVVPWMSITITASEADALAAHNRRYAESMETFDKLLEEGRSHFDVHSSQGTYVSSAQLRCANVALSLQGERVTNCQLGCYRQFGIPALDCWRDTRIEQIGLCVLNNDLGLRLCSRNCTK